MNEALGFLVVHSNRRVSCCCCGVMSRCALLEGVELDVMRAMSTMRRVEVQLTCLQVTC